MIQVPPKNVALSRLLFLIGAATVVVILTWPECASGNNRNRRGRHWRHSHTSSSSQWGSITTRGRGVYGGHRNNVDGDGIFEVTHQTPKKMKSHEKDEQRTPVSSGGGGDLTKKQRRRANSGARDRDDEESRPPRLLQWSRESLTNKVMSELELNSRWQRGENSVIAGGGGGGGDDDVGTNTCSTLSCEHSELEISKRTRVFQIHQLIMKDTGLEELPNMTNFVLPRNPDLMNLIKDVNRRTRRMNKLNDVEGSHNNNHHHPTLSDEAETELEETFFVTATPSAAAGGPDFVRIPGRQPIHFFNLSEEHSSNVAVANLHILLKGLSPQQSPPVLPPPDQKEAMISVFKITRPKYHNGLHRLSSVVTDLRVPYNGGDTQWVKIDVYSMVHDWLIRPEDNLGFVVKATTNSGAAVAVSSVEEDLPNAPLLQLKVRQVRNERTKRYASNRVCSEKKPEKNCCLYPLTMDFTLLKFDFIVAPKKYVANFCRGKCPPLLAHQMPHVTLLQQMFPNSTESNHGACCGGSDMAPLKIVYFDGQRIKISTINDMVVKACSCN